MFKIIVRDPQPTRIEMLITEGKGPLISSSAGEFDPRRDVSVYIDGAPTKVSSFVWDLARNRYVLFVDKPFNTRGVIQVIHHMPNPPFATVGNPNLANLSPGSHPDLVEFR